MSDPTESLRRERLAEINAEPGSREAWKPSAGKSGTPPNFVRTSMCLASLPP